MRFQITIKEGITPVIHLTRKYPVHLRQELKEELERMEELGVIDK